MCPCCAISPESQPSSRLVDSLGFQTSKPSHGCQQLLPPSPVFASHGCQQLLPPSPVFASQCAGLTRQDPRTGFRSSRPRCDPCHTSSLKVAHIDNLPKFEVRALWYTVTKARSRTVLPRTCITSAATWNAATGAMDFTNVPPACAIKFRMGRWQLWMYALERASDHHQHLRHSTL